MRLQNANLFDHPELSVLIFSNSSSGWSSLFVISRLQVRGLFGDQKLERLLAGVSDIAEVVVQTRKSKLTSRGLEGTQEQYRARSLLVFI